MVFQAKNQPKAPLQWQTPLMRKKLIIILAALTGRFVHCRNLALFRSSSFTFQPRRQNASEDTPSSHIFRSCLSYTHKSTYVSTEDQPYFTPKVGVDSNKRYSIHQHSFAASKHFRTFLRKSRLFLEPCAITLQLHRMSQTRLRE